MVTYIESTHWKNGNQVCSDSVILCQAFRTDGTAGITHSLMFAKFCNSMFRMNKQTAIRFFFFFRYYSSMSVKWHVQAQNIISNRIRIGASHALMTWYCYFKVLPAMLKINCKCLVPCAIKKSKQCSMVWCTAWNAAQTAPVIIFCHIWLADAAVGIICWLCTTECKRNAQQCPSIIIIQHLQLADFSGKPVFHDKLRSDSTPYLTV